jgi:ferredoxin-thioredoxin reductase catalytic subunit
MMSDQADGETEAVRCEITERIRKHVAESACRLNPDAKLVAALVEGLVKRRARFGDFYCPIAATSARARRTRPRSPKPGCAIAIFSSERRNCRRACRCRRRFWWNTQASEYGGNRWPKT